ncbi:serpin family protein [Thermodesulfobacteriota bacterium]
MVPTRNTIRQFCILLLIPIFLYGCGGGESDQSQGGSSKSNFVEIENYISSEQSALDATDDLTTFNSFIEDYNRFAIDYFQLLTEDEDNVIFSPFSYSNIFGMLILGGVDTTKDELQNIISDNVLIDDQLPAAIHSLAQSLLSKNSVHGFHSSNKLWGHTGYRFHINYLNNLSSYFQTEATPLNFTILGSDYSEVITQWISDNTDPMINPSTLYSTPMDTRLVLANASTLSAQWQVPVNNVATFDGLFEDLKGRRHEVPMINMKGSMNTFQDDEVFAVELFLASDNLSMVVFMPTGPEWIEVYGDKFTYLREDKGESFNDGDEHWVFVKAIGEYYKYTSYGIVSTYMGGTIYYDFKDEFFEKYQTIINSLSPQQVEVNLPIFSIETNSRRLSPTQENSYYYAFQEDGADFSGINGLGYLFVSNFKLNAAISLDEKGLKNSGSSLALFKATPDEPYDVWESDGTTSWGYFAWCSNDVLSGYQNTPQPPPSHARPFIFVVRDNSSNAILYIGSLVDAGGKIVH